MIVQEKTRQVVVRERVATVIRRRQIVNAACKLIVKYGSEHVTVRRMAAEIGVSEGAIYRHFKSKEDILSWLIDDVENTLLSELQLKPTGSPYTLDNLERIITNHMAGVVQRRGMSFQVIAEIISFGDKVLNRKAYNVINRYVDHIKDILREGVKVGVIREDLDLEASASMFFGMTQGLVNTWALSGYGFDLEQKYASLWKLFREAIIEH